MRLRNHVFYTLSDLNIKIKVLMADLNNRQQRMYPGSRKEQFDLLDKPALATDCVKTQNVNSKPCRDRCSTL
jgi:hypothetical protein